MALKTANTTINSGTRIDDNRDGFFDTLTYSGRTIKVGTQAQGWNYGYASGGMAPDAVGSNVIDRIPFANYADNAVDVGDLSIARGQSAGQSSNTHGYVSSGHSIPVASVIDRFPFAASTTDATDVGDLFETRLGAMGGTYSDTYGYTSGGQNPTASVTIDRYPFAVSTTNASDVGNLTHDGAFNAGQSSTEYGYNSGGGQPGSLTSGGYENIIDRWPFASASVDAADVGDITLTRGVSAGLSSQDYGYQAGGYSGPPNQFRNTIDRWPFAATTTNAADVGDLSAALGHESGQNSTEYGHVMGAIGPGGSLQNFINRWPFAAEVTNATDLGDVTVSRGAAAGNQY